MDKLPGKNIYLGTLERDQFKLQWEAFGFDMDDLTEPPNIGNTKEKADVIFDRIKKGQGKTLVDLGIFLNDGTIIGDIDLHDIEWMNRSAELGIGIIKDQRGKGYGTEAMGLLIQYAFAAMGLDRVHANTMEHNFGCRKALENNGFIQEGVNRQAVYIGGRYCDRILYSILRNEWLQRRV